MWSKIYIICSLLTGILGDIPFSISRSLSTGVKSAGYQVLYGDEDLMVLNEVTNDFEKVDALKSGVDLNEALPPLPPEDVKCMMSVDRHCSKEMAKIKASIIQAITNDCKQCSDDQKEKAGKVIASLMAHDSMAWKLFLTRLALVTQSKARHKEDILKAKMVGKPEEIQPSKDRYVYPGVKVRVKSVHIRQFSNFMYHLNCKEEREQCSYELGPPWKRTKYIKNM